MYVQCTLGLGSGVVEFSVSPSSFLVYCVYGKEKEGL